MSGFSLPTAFCHIFVLMDVFQFVIDFILHIDRHMIELVQEYHMWTYAILFAIIFCETGLVVTPFLPGDSLLFVAGAITALPDMPLEAGYLSLIVFAAAVLGDSCNYMIGRFLGKRLFRNPDSKIFRQSYLDKTHDFFKKYGGKTIILARFVPIVRTFAPFVAGMGKMHYTYFILYNAVGGAIWVTLFCYVGYFFGDLPFEIGLGGAYLSEHLFHITVVPLTRQIPDFRKACVDYVQLPVIVSANRVSYAVERVGIGGNGIFRGKFQRNVIGDVTNGRRRRRRIR